MPEQNKNIFLEAFDLKFVIQMVTIIFLIGAAWGSIEANFKSLTEEIQTIKTDRVKVWAEQKVMNDKVNTDIEECRDNHFELMKKLDILIVELQNGKYCAVKK